MASTPPVPPVERAHVVPQTRFSRWLRRYSICFDLVCIAGVVLILTVKLPMIGLAAASAGGMVVADFVGTALGRAEAIGRGDIAGEADRTSTLMKFLIYSSAGTALFHNFGLWGWIGVTPTLLVDRHVTNKTTQLVKRMRPGPGVEV